MTIERVRALVDATGPETITLEYKESNTPRIVECVAAFANKGEVTTTAVWELKEETGLIVDPAQLTVAGIIHGAWGVEAQTDSSRSSSRRKPGLASR